MNSKGLHHQKGIALLAVLAVSVALSLLITSATVMMQRQLDIGETAKQQFLGKVAVYKKSQELAYLLATQRITRAGVSKGASSAGTRKVDGRFTSTLTGDEIRLDGYLYQSNVNGVSVQYSLQAEDGLIPINNSDQQWLIRWLQSYGLNDFEITTLTNQVADFADPDSWAKPAGAESFDYIREAKKPPSNFLFQRCSEMNHVLEARTQIIEKSIDTNECSLSRSPTVNLNAMPLQLLKNIFGNKGESIYMKRSNARWLQTTTEAILSFNSLNNISENYVSVISKSPVIIKVRSEEAKKTLKVERGVNKIRPLTTRL